MLVRTEKQLEALGVGLARRFVRESRRGPIVLALVGELGAGKTTFLRGFAYGLGIRKRVASPTFVLARRYRIPKKQNNVRWFWHIDAYRLRKESDLASIDFREIARDPGNSIAIEWADRVSRAIPKKALWIFFRHAKTGRSITIKKHAR